MRAIACACALVVTHAGCAVLGFRVPCEADADCPGDARCGDDGLCGAQGAGEGEGEGEGERVDEGECEGLREENASWPEGARVVVAGLFAPTSGCYPSLERALTDKAADDMHVFLPAGRDYIVEDGPVTIEVFNVTIEGESREGTVIRGDSALLDVPLGATITDVTIEVPGAGSAIVGFGPEPNFPAVETPTLHLTGVTFAEGSGGAVSLDDIALQANDVRVEDNLGIALRQDGDPNVANHFTSSTFDNAPLRLSGDNSTSIDACTFRVSEAAWLELGAAMVHVSSETHIEAVAEAAACVAGVRVVAGAATFRFTRFDALECPAIHLVQPTESAGPIVRVDLGSTLDSDVEPQDGPHGANSFASAPAIVVDKPTETGTIDAVGNEWPADDPTLCGHSIRASTGVSVKYGAAVDEACLVRCATAVPYAIADDAHVVNASQNPDGVRCHAELGSALDDAAADPASFVWLNADLYEGLAGVQLLGSNMSLMGAHPDDVTLSGTWPLFSANAPGLSFVGVTLAGSGSADGTVIEWGTEALSLSRVRLASAVPLRGTQAITLDQVEVQRAGLVEVGGAGHLTMTRSLVLGGTVRLSEQATAAIGGATLELGNLLFADAGRSALEVNPSSGSIVTVENTTFDDGSEADGLLKCAAQAVLVTSGMLVVRNSLFTDALGTSDQDCAGIRIVDSAGASSVNLGQASSLGGNTFSAPLAVAIDVYAGGTTTVSAIGNTWLDSEAVCAQVTVGSGASGSALQWDADGVVRCEYVP